MTGNCKVLNIFKTSIGNILLVEFYDDILPSIGMVLSDGKGFKCRISGIGMGKPSLPQLDTLGETFASVWDCRSDFLGEKHSVNIGSILTILS